MKRICGPSFFIAVLMMAGSVVAQGQDTATRQPVLERSLLGPQGHALFDIRFEQTPLRDALEFLAAVADENIIVPEGVEGSVTTNFHDVTIEDAIHAVIKVNGLDYTVEGSVIRLGKGDDFKDTGENLRTQIVQLNYAIAKDMVKPVASLLSSRGAVFADDRTNSLIIRDLPANLDNAARYLGQVDVRDAQVLIEAKILEATRSFSRSLGIQWGVNKTTGDVRVQGVEGVGLADSDRTLNVDLPATSPSSGLTLLLGQFSGTNIDVQLTAAEDRGDVYVISDPNIVTSNGMPAKIRSGTTLLINASGNINIGAEGGGATSGGAGLQQIETGIELKVTPYISIDHFVKMDIEATTSTPDFTRAIEGIPVITDNEAKTTVLVKDGETTIIGGLSRLSNNVSETRVPGFSRIP
ncbi:MAG: secretin and TonB N-terminal domain-containing protein, partial [Deltaproteobacteria bacterium]|nr:secretin and TonB N-terminal domain-containing protein [Deltaproteobacteria bacterium]